MSALPNGKYCCGCGACANICPHLAIQMEPDEEGFLYPQVDGKRCVSCGLCQKACPYENSSYADMSEPTVYAYQHKNSDVLEKSSSGGAFTGICEAFCDHNYLIFGAAFGDNFKVTHQAVNFLKDAAIFSKSKYVQSEMDKVHISLKQALLEGKKVIFSGTPCQVASINSFLGKPYPNLLTIDLICHGVPSPLFFQQYKAYLENQYHGTMVKYDFRNKKNGWENSDVCAVFSNGKEYRKHTYSQDDAYMKGFLQRVGCRLSCYECPFARIPRASDFTVGDLWGIEKILPSRKDNRGTSVILANSQKASGFISDLKKNAFLQEIPLEKVIQSNQNLIRHSAYNPLREQFMRDMKDMPFYELQKKYLKPQPIIYRIASKVLSKKLKNHIKKILK